MIRARRPSRLLLVAAAVATVALLPAAATAQQEEAGLPSPGARVRLHFPGGLPQRQGEFVRASDDTLWVRYPGDSYAGGRPFLAAVARRDLRELRVYRGLGPRRVGRGMGIGLLVGAGIGAAVGGVMGATDPEGAEWFGGLAGTMAVMAGVGAVPGVVIGGLVSLRRPEVWVRVPLR